MPSTLQILFAAIAAAAVVVAVVGGGGVLVVGGNGSVRWQPMLVFFLDCSLLLVKTPELPIRHQNSAEAGCQRHPRGPSGGHQ